MFGRHLYYPFVYLLPIGVALLQLPIPLLELKILPIFVPIRDDVCRRCCHKNVVICLIGRLLAGVVISQRSDEVGFGGEDSVGLQVVQEDGFRPGGLLGDVVVLR